MIINTHGMSVRALDALLEAADLPLDGQEWHLALDVLHDLLAELDEEPPNLPEQIVDAVEKFVGLGLEEARYMTTVAAVRRALAPAHTPPQPTFAPDAFLEAEYENRFADIFAAD